MKTCKQCGNKFEPKNEQEEYCSTTCWEKRWGIGENDGKY